MKLVILLVCIFSFFANSGPSDWYNWYEPLTVKDIRVQGNRNIISFRTIEPHMNPNGTCNNGYYSIANEGLSKEMLSLLLTAHASGKKIGINVDGTQCEKFGRILVTQVRIL